jgi:hypothetical protein
MKVVYSPKHLPAAVDANDQHDDDDMYEVDYIMQHREVNGKYEYLIKWKGFDKSDATWEPEEHINDPQPVERYFKLLSAKKQAKRVSANALASSGTEGVVLMFKQ